MKKRIIVYLVAVSAFAFIAFQLYTMYDMVFKVSTVVADIEDDIVIRQGSEDDNRIAFTCNVDWGEEILPTILNILEENNLTITFFISGRWAENNPDLLRKIYIAGHEIQNHGYRHRMCSKLSDSEVKDEIVKTEDAIYNFTGIKTNIFAPPSGDYDKRTVDICKEMGYYLSLWSVDTIDWRPGSTAEIIKNRVFKKKLNGAVLLMHPKEETAKALPDIISGIEKQGISIVTFTELINTDESL